MRDAMSGLILFGLVLPSAAPAQWSQLHPDVWNGQGDPVHRSTVMLAAEVGLHSLSVDLPGGDGSYSIHSTDDDWASDSSLTVWSYPFTPQARELTRASASGMFYIHDFGPRMVRYLTLTGQTSPGMLLDHSIVGPLAAVDDTVCFWMTLNEWTTADTLQIMKSSATDEFGEALGRVVIPVHGRPTLSFRDSDNGVLAAQNTSLITHIFTTNDGGFEWEDQVSLPDTYLHEVSYMNDSTIWAVGDDGIALRSVDGGNTWVDLDLNVSEDIWSVSGYSADSVWLSGTGGLVLATGNAGNSWVERLLPGVHVQRIQTLDGAVYAHDPNGYLFRYDPTTNLTEPTIGTSSWWSISATGLSLHPMAGESINRLDLLDASGRCMSTNLADSMIDLRDVPTGLYVVRLTSDRRQESAQFFWSSTDH